MSAPPTAMDTVNAALASTDFSCKHVCADYASRGEQRGALFSYGSTNITDAYLEAKDGTPLFTVRSDNWNEKFVEIPVASVRLLAGNCDSDSELRHVTLSEFLHAPVQFGAAYTGLDASTSLSDGSLRTLKARFETVFLPVKERDDGRDEMQFAVQTFSNLVQSEEEPRNLMLLATTEGLSVQADGSNSKRLLLHMGADNEVNEYWLKAESSTSPNGEQRGAGVGGNEVRKLSRSGSGGISIGALKMRSNVLMVIQVPIVWNPVSFVGKPSGGAPAHAAQPASSPVFGAGRGATGTSVGSGPGPMPVFDAPVANMSGPARAGEFSGSPINKTSFDAGRTIGKCRVSRGELYGRYSGLSKKFMQRNLEKVIITCLIIKTVPDGVPSAADVLAAAADMESLYNKSAESKSSYPMFGSMTPNRTGTHVPRNFSAQAPATPPVQPLVAHSVQIPNPSPASSSLSRLQAVSNIVMTKLKGLESVPTLSEAAVLELKLLAIGALRSKSVRTLLESKFNLLSNAIRSGNGSGAKELLLELELLVQGSFDLLEMAATQNFSGSIVRDSP